MFAAVPTRAVVGLMMFFAVWISAMSKANISLNIVAMVPQKSNVTTIKSECTTLANQSSGYSDEYYSTSMTSRTPSDSVTFDWSAQEQGYILSAYFWGYLVTGMTGGPLAEFMGIRNLMFSTQCLCAVLTILSPPIARIHYMGLVVIRVIEGIASGAVFPALQMLVAHWAPPEEKGLFVSGLLASSIGTVATWTLTAVLTDNFGWEYGFYVPGAIALAFSVLWWFLVYDSPEVHPRISAKEKEYIISKISDTLQHSRAKVVPPLKSMFMSGPFWALMVLHYGHAWGYYFAMTAAPKYVSTALGFKLSSTGILASVPYLARWIFSMIFGVIGDIIMKRRLMSTTAIRKFFCIFSHILPSALMVALGYLGCSPILSIFVITSVLASNSSVCLTNFANSHDLAPNYSGTIFGIVNGISSTAGIITPLITAYFTKNGNGFAEWRPVFMLGAAVYFASAVYFIVFGTGALQKWNEIVGKEDQKDENPKI